MVQIFPAFGPAKPHPLAAALSSGINQYISQEEQRNKQNLQQSQLAQGLFGDQGNQFSNQSVDTQLKIAQLQQNEMLKGQQIEAKEQERQVKLQEKIAPLQAALERVQRMRNIGSKGNLGRGSAAKGLWGGQTSRDREEYSQLGKSLISLATTIPIRNRLEFETLAEKLYDASMPDQARAGVLDAMERIIQNSMSQFQGPQQNQAQQPQGDRPPITTFDR